MQSISSGETAKKGTLDRVINYFSPSWGLSRAEKRMRLELAQYRGAEITRLRSGWLTFGESTPTPAADEQRILRDRSRDAIRNDPAATGAIDTIKINVVGGGLKPQSGIRAKILGISEERAENLRNQAELAFDKFKPTAHSANILDFDEIQFLALSKIIEDGETIAIPTWAREPWRSYGRCIELLESERLATPKEHIGKISNGIETGRRGQPIFYYVRKPNKKGYVLPGSDYNKIPARDGKGRPKILHVYQSRRPGQMRGIPLFAPVLSYFKDLNDYLEAEIVAARVAACLAVFITKADPVTAAVNLGTVQPDGVNRYQELTPGMVGYLSPGESINTVAPTRPGETFDKFVEQLLRLIGVALQLPYELLVKDFSKTNYSSARAALLEGRRAFSMWRNWFSRKFCQPIWELVLEEAYLRGYFDAPDFYEYKAEYCRAFWMGGGWGWVDPVKEVDASHNAIAANLSTLAEESAGQGRDWEETLYQRARERKKAAELELTDVADQQKKNGETKNADNEKD